MLGRQTKLLEAYRRIVDFVTTSPPPGANAKFAELSDELRRVVERIEEYSKDQEFGQRQGRAATVQLRVSMKQLRERHLRPLVTIARASVTEYPGIAQAIRLPRRRLGSTVLEAEARALRDNAVRYEQLFIEYGRNPDFLSELDGAIAKIRQARLQCARTLGLQVGATAGVAEELRRARQLASILECQILSGYADASVKLAEWRSAKRVQSKPGARREPSEVDVPVVQEFENMVESAQLQLIAA